MNDDDRPSPQDLDPARLLPFSKEIGTNPWGKAIEGGAFNEPYRN